MIQNQNICIFSNIFVDYNICMNEYSTTKKQNSLLQLAYDTSQLQLLQITSKSKIQIVSFKGTKTIKSIDDRYRKLRILLVAFFVKVFLFHNSQNQERLKTLKRIVYSAKLQTITQQKGILKQHLLKSIAQQLKTLKIGNVQYDIIKMFNCTPFFDRTLMNALQQSNPLIVQNDCELTIWMDREMQFKLLWNEESLVYQNENQLFLVGLGEKFHAQKDCKCHECNFKDFKEYLRFSIQQTTQHDKTETIYANDTKAGNKLFSQSYFQQQPEGSPTPNNFLYKTLELSNSYSSPSQIKPIKLNQFQSVGLFDSLNSKKESRKNSDIDFQMKQSSKQSKQFQKDKDKTIKLRREAQKEQKKQPSSFWNLLCCSSDNK